MAIGINPRWPFCVCSSLDWLYALTQPTIPCDYPTCKGISRIPQHSRDCGPSFDPPMAKSKHRLLSGPDLFSFLASSRCELPIKLIEVSGDMVGYVTYPQAMAMVRSGEYTGKCGASRVLYLRHTETRKPNLPDASYWDDRACGLYRWVKGQGMQETAANSGKIWDRWANAL